MAVTLNALTTGVGGLQTTGDTSGSISLQSNGSTVLAMTSSGVTITGTLSATGTVIPTPSTATTWTAPQRGTVTDNVASLSFNMNTTNNFKTTPTATGALTFTNITAGQSGYILLANTGGYAITIGASTGTYVTIPNGVTAQVYTDGTNFYSSQTGSAGDFNVNGTLTAANITDAGTLSVTGNTTVGGTLAVTGTSTFTGNSTFSGTVTGASFTGAGTGLTGTGNSFTAGAAKAVTNSGGWSVTPSGTTLYFNYNGTNVAKLDSSGNFTTIANITAYGTV